MIRSEKNSLDIGYGVRTFVILFVSAYILFVFFYTARFPGISEALKTNWPYALVCSLAATGYLLYINRIYRRELTLLDSASFRDYMERVKIRRVKINRESADEFHINFGILSRPVELRLEGAKLVFTGPSRHIRQLEEMFRKQNFIDETQLL